MDYSSLLLPSMTSPEMLLMIRIVREFMRDYPETNRMTMGEESSNRMIAWAVCDAVSEFNSAAPITSYSLHDLLGFQQSSLLVRLTVCTLLEGVALLQSRNQLQYQSGETAIRTMEQVNSLMNWLQYFRSTVDQRVLRNKVSLNIRLAMTPGGIHSEYWAINANYYP